MSADAECITLWSDGFRHVKIEVRQDEDGKWKYWMEAFLRNRGAGWPERERFDTREDAIAKAKETLIHYIAGTEEEAILKPLLRSEQLTFGGME